jgi:hypothetical protein
MEREKFDEISGKLKYEREKWLLFHEIDNIILKSGKGFYPDWKYLRFLITKDSKILVRHGVSKPYGARISGLTMVSNDYTSLYFTKTDKGIPIENSSFYNEWFRQPKAGDMVRVSENLTRSYGESMIKDVTYTFNSVIVNMWMPIVFPSTGKISFYDPGILKDTENCIHSTIHEGIYMHFEPNQSKSKSKFGLHHEVINIKDIKEINLKVGKEYFNKTYKLE